MKVDVSFLGSAKLILDKKDHEALNKLKLKIKDRMDNQKRADVLALDIPAVSSSSLAKVEQYKQLKKEMQG